MEKLTTNLQLRIISAIVMILIVTLFLILGRLVFALGFLMVMVACFWEFYVNFLKENLDLPGMMFSVFFMAAGLLLYIAGKSIFNYFAIIQCFILGMAVFFKDKINWKKIFEKFPWSSALLFFLPLTSMMILISGSINWPIGSWRVRVIILFVLVFATDIFAWYFGKKYGKKKLGPISPSKTWEGLIMGSAAAYLLGVIIYFIMVRFDPLVLIMFLPAGFIAQLGDLAQSKIKRDFELKDSSNIIPGHGGIFDRLDALIFTLPFYVLVLQILQR